MTDPTAAFTKMVPGFDFLQGLVKNAGAALPGVGQWIAPTLNPEELDKRIEELRTVQFWLEQNARMLAATIQALEVQRMTLSTLRTMNVSVDELRDSMTLRMPESAPAPTAAAAGKARDAAAASAPVDRDAGTAPAGVVDPMQWWGALTKQFTQLATAAMRDMGADAAKGLAASTGKPASGAAPAAPSQAAAPAARAPRSASGERQPAGGGATTRSRPAAKKRPR